MPTIKMTEFENVPAGLYPAKFIKIEQKSMPFGPAFEWTFQVTQQVGVVKPGTDVTGLTSQLLTPNSKMYKWIQAFGVGNIAIDQDFNTDTILNKDVIVEVTLAPSKKKEGAFFSNVTDVKNLQTLAALQQAIAPPVVPQQPVNAVATQQVAAPTIPIVTPTPIATPVTPVVNTTVAPTTPASTLEIGDDEPLF